MINKKFLIFFIIGGISFNIFATNTNANLTHFKKSEADDPCAGPYSLLSIIDRPTVGDSVCVVPYKNALLELGIEYQKFSPQGQQQNFPEAVFRLGLPAHNEFVVILPNYIHTSIPSQTGYSASTIGIKHEIGYNQHWVAAVESLITLPSGSATFGSDGLGAAFNGVVNYSFDSPFSLTFMLGVTTQATASNEGGQHFTSVNPDLVLSWTPQERLQIYGEIYGQSQTGPGESSGFNFDTGVIYLLSKNFSIDVEVGQRLTGVLGNFDHYVGAGMALMW